jgi:hypothetical protein
MNTVGVPRTSVAAGSRLRHWCEPPWCSSPLRVRVLDRHRHRDHIGVPGAVQDLQLTVLRHRGGPCRTRDRRVRRREAFDDVGVWPTTPDPGTGNWPNPERANYGSSASFSDPDGNGCLLQEVRTRAPGETKQVDRED